MTWGLEIDPPPPRFTLLGRGIGLLRGLALLVLLVLGLCALVLARGAEIMLRAQSRPLAGRVVQYVCRMALRVLGLRLRVQGQALRGRGAIVANHCSWLDILVLNACAPVFFVAKAEVGRWPGIGTLARLAGTVFIARVPAQAAQQKALFESRLRAGHRLLFFPEGTSSDGLRVLPFKSTLFAAFFTPELRPLLHIQPTALRYTAPLSQDARFYGWWGGMEFGGHFTQILCQPRQGRVDVAFGAAVALNAAQDRKTLASACENSVRALHQDLSLR
ncbi:MAG: lysophospholipid acyltransferase family protein [Roseinatronobacter sp.]